MFWQFVHVELNYSVHGQNRGHKGTVAYIVYLMANGIPFEKIKATNIDMKLELQAKIIMKWHTASVFHMR